MFDMATPLNSGGALTRNVHQQNALSMFSVPLEVANPPSYHYRQAAHPPGAKSKAKERHQTHVELHIAQIIVFYRCESHRLKSPEPEKPVAQRLGV